MSEEDIPKLRQPVTDSDHVQGPPNAEVTLLEYGDYQCPYCGEAHPIVKNVQAKFGSKLRYVFRNFPLTNVHPFAETGAEIAEAAGAQGKFWEMHDFLYEHQSKLSDPTFFLQYARERLGLDSERIARELSSHTYLSRIRSDFSSGVRSGVNGTPTFFINGLRHNGDYEFETLVEAIEGAARPTEKKVAAKSATKRKKTPIPQ
jgi:protein-disulfide isomerase